jgi:hypothetical protein
MIPVVLTLLNVQVVMFRQLAHTSSWIVRFVEA